MSGRETVRALRDSGALSKPDQPQGDAFGAILFAIITFSLGCIGFFMITWAIKVMPREITPMPQLVIISDPVETPRLE